MFFIGLLIGVLIIVVLILMYITRQNVETHEKNWKLFEPWFQVVEGRLKKLEKKETEE